jgi:hypothetical protein
MYKIIGADQKEYGPVTTDQIRAWIAEGRVNAQTKVQPVGADWKSLGELPEFADAFAPRVTPPPITPALPGAAITAGQKTSGLAITSLVLGILGFFTCGISAIVGLILGIIALVKIKNSNGRLSGNGVAIAGTVVSAIFLLMIPIFAAMLLPAFAKAKSKAQTVACVNNMKQIALAVKIYSGDNNDQLPPAATWCDAIHTEVGTDRVFKCPAGEKAERSHYAFNAKLGGLNETNIAPNTVMIFETRGGWNVNGGRELMLTTPRHDRRFVVALADGSVQQLYESQLGSLRWDP